MTSQFESCQTKQRLERKKFRDVGDFFLLSSQLIWTMRPAWLFRIETNSAIIWNVISRRLLFDGRFFLSETDEFLSCQLEFVISSLQFVFLMKFSCWIHSQFWQGTLKFFWVAGNFPTQKVLSIFLFSSQVRLHKTVKFSENLMTKCLKVTLSTYFYGNSWSF